MKIITYNVKGLHNSTKAKALWSWLFTENIDVCCLQEHKLHHLAGSILHYRGYTLFYGGKKGGYSGTLTCIKTTLNPTIVLNHESGRCLGTSVQSPFGTILMYNVYAHNEYKDRTLLWQLLLQTPVFDGILCGDFNTVVSLDDSTTGASTMSFSEKQEWDILNNMHALQDSWSLLHSHSEFTFHSQAHTKSWARLDRIYLSGAEWYPPTASITVCSEWHLSDHFPLLLHLKEYN